MAHLLGFDVGSSSIKASLLEAETGRVVASVTSPDTELSISAPRPGWAEQDPRVWWDHVRVAAAALKDRAGAAWADVRAIGLSYQMHGLVLVDDRLEVLRPAIIWCDSRAVEVGARAFRDLGEEWCLRHLLGSPGNFTAAKLGWVKQHEPEVYARVHKAMLPGDYLALRLTGEVLTTPAGLSEGVVWDFLGGVVSEEVLAYFGIARDLLPQVTPVFSPQGTLTRQAAAELGLPEGVVVSYRAGDQPNNAFSLGVLDPGEVAATAGTSGVVYGVVDRARSDPRSRVGTFVHVNHTATAPRYGVLLCVNGAAILNRWLRTQVVGGTLSYGEMNQLAAAIPAGAAGLSILPYGNGAERTLENRVLGASVHGLDLNLHTRAHLLRAAQEGIVYALAYGLDLMAGVGLEVRGVRAGQANLFLSPLFSEAFATLTGVPVVLYNTDGAQGAARGAGVGAGLYADCREALANLQALRVIEPDERAREAYREAYDRWHGLLERQLVP